jgi:thymidylate synthase (FAD)
VAAARVSYGAGTKTKLDDKKLIYYMLEHEHTSPFEQVILLFHVKLPIFVARQWIRHRTARVNEMSGRFSELPEEVYVPHMKNICVQDKVNKQGGAEPIGGDLAYKTQQSLVQVPVVAFSKYHEMLRDGVARETARELLPLSTYTEWYWQIDLHNLFHFLKLRLDSHAQAEIRDYAKVMAEMTKAVAPVAYAAFEEFELHAIKLSATEARAVHNVIEMGDDDIRELLERKMKH